MKEFLVFPIDREELETLYLKRSKELLQLKAFLAARNLFTEYLATVTKGEAK